MNSRESHSSLPVNQPQLFGADVPALSKQGSTEQPSSYIEERKAARDRAFDRADRLMLERYEECLKFVGRARSTFGAWTVTAIFEDKYGELDTHSKKALGALFAHLLHAGVIEEAGFGKRPNGNVGPTYKLNG